MFKFTMYDNSTTQGYYMFKFRMYDNSTMQGYLHV